MFTSQFTDTVMKTQTQSQTHRHRHAYTYTDTYTYTDAHIITFHGQCVNIFVVCPDGSSFVTCPCACKKSAPASFWYFGLTTCDTGQDTPQDWLDTFLRAQNRMYVRDVVSDNEGHGSNEDSNEGSGKDSSKDSDESSKGDIVEDRMDVRDVDVSDLDLAFGAVDVNVDRACIHFSLHSPTSHLPPPLLLLLLLLGSPSEIQEFSLS